MVANKTFHPIDQYSLGNGTLNVNLYKNTYIYNYFLTSYLFGNYEMNISLMYNSKYYETNLRNYIKIGFGNGWKFNLQQYLFEYKEEYNIEGFSLSDWVYIDSNWCIHRFVKNRTETNNDIITTIYLDSDNNGLKLIKEGSSNCKIIDETGNTLIFDRETSSLINIISGVNSGINKCLNYDANNNLKSIYDTRSDNKRIYINYNSSNLPMSILTSEYKCYYTLVYEDNKLFKIYKEFQDDKKEIHRFNYLNGTLYLITNSEDKSALCVESNKFEKYIRVSEGTVKEKVIIEDTSSEINLGENSYFGDDLFLTNEVGKIIGKEYKFLPEDIFNETLYNYMPNYTEIINVMGKKTRLQFDIDGKQVSCFEYNEAEDNLEYLNTLDEPTGWELNINGLSNTFINNYRCKEINRFEQCYKLSINNECLSEFLSYFENENDNSNQFTISFWVKFNTHFDSNKLAYALYSVNNFVYGEEVIISETLPGVWQKVNIPIYLDGDQSLLEYIDIVLYLDTDADASSDSILIGDVRLNKGVYNRIYIDSSKYDKKESKILGIGQKIYLYKYGIGEKEVTLSQDFYMTEADIFATYQNIYECESNSKLYFDLSYNNRTKAMPVTYVSLYPYELTDDENIRKQHLYYTFGFNSYNSNDQRTNVNYPNYRIRNVSLSSIKEDKKTYCVKDTYQEIKKINDNLYSYETKTFVNTKDNNPFKVRLSIDDSSCISQNTYSNGLNVANSYYYLDEEGSLLVENHECNEYDDFGNILRKYKKIINHNNQETIIENTNIYTYNVTSPSARTIYYKEETNGIISTIKYNIDETIKCIKYSSNKKYDSNIINTTEQNLNNIYFIYNDFQELIGYKFRNANDIEYGESNLVYHNGKLCNINDGKDINFGFVYNGSNELCKVFLNKCLLLHNYTERTQNNNLYYTVRYNGNNNYKTINKFNDVGNIIESKLEEYDDGIKINEKTVNFEYENFINNFSNLHQRIKKIIDPFSNKVFTFTYTDSKSDGTIVLMNDNNGFEVTSKPNGTKLYEINNEPIVKKTFEVIDLINNLPKNTYYYSKNNNDYNEIKYFCSEYHYDLLNRFVCQKYKHLENESYNTNIHKVIEYYENTNIPKKLIYQIGVCEKENDEECINYSQFEYDYAFENGNISKILEFGNRYVNKPIDSNSCEKSDLITRNIRYEYDSMNRLSSEITTNNDVYSYYYDDICGMPSAIVKNGQQIVSFEHDNGLLTKVIRNDIINILYDYYGNITAIGDISLGYNERNLLSSYSKGNNTISFEYSYNGLRTKKTCETYDVRYYYDGNQLIGEDIVYQSGNIIKYRYFYDANGICGINYIYNNENHYYNLYKDLLNNVSKIMSEGKMLAEYHYDAWGNCKTHIFEDVCTTEDVFIINNNPFRYRGYYYDVETGLAMVGQRYYSPELCRFIQPADVSTLNPRSINGLNLYSFANNNPIGIAYSSFGATFGTSDGTIGSTRGTIGNIVGSGSVGGGSKISGFGSLGGSSFSSINWPKANSVAKTHYTTSLIKNPFISLMLGNISYTKTVQLNSAETFYSFSDIGNDGYSLGFGFNFGNWHGGSVYVSSDIGFGSSWQLTPWLTGSSGWSLENGISISGGVIIGDTTHEITVSIGNGALLGYAACAGIAALPMPGARAVAATAACIIFIIDLFN